MQRVIEQPDVIKLSLEYQTRFAMRYLPLAINPGLKRAFPKHLDMIITE